MKSFVVGALAASIASAAVAQSSVTLFGIVDAAVQKGRGSIASRTQLVNSGHNSSRLGFRGTEDLGGGMSASFWLEAGLNNDDGSGVVTSANNQTTGSGGGGLTFNRRSTVSLASTLGELRLGRDFTPQYWSLATFDPFGTTGLGGTMTFSGIITGLTSIRASNSIGYFLPANLGGFYGQAQYYLGENGSAAAATENDGTGYGLRLGYAAGPLNVAIATGHTKYAAGNVRQNNIGGTWNFGVARLFAHYSWDRAGARDAKGWLLGAQIPVGPHEVRTSYSTYKADPNVVAAASPEARKVAIAYVHNLSKRTAVYTTFARLRNEGGSARGLGGATTAPNGTSTGYDVGIRHAF